MIENDDLVIEETIMCSVLCSLTYIQKDAKILILYLSLKNLKLLIDSICLKK